MSSVLFTPTKVKPLVESSLKKESLSDLVEEVFDAKVSKPGYIHFDIPRLKGCEKNRAYAIWNDETRPIQIYIGKTSQIFKKRINQHTYLINHPYRPEANTALYKAIRKNPQEFKCGILKFKDLSPYSYEKLLISLIPSASSLNLNGGGGGGTSALDPLLTPPGSHVKAARFETPAKYYSVSIKNGMASVDFTPDGKKTTGVVYVFLNHRTNHRMIGYTGRRLSKRVGEHLSKAGSSSGSHPFYKQLKEDPKSFKVGILAKHIPRRLLPNLEKEYIDEKMGQGPLYNLNKGGGGSI